MPDIAKCQHTDCEKSQECYRFVSEPNQHQCFVDFKQICRSPDFRWFCPLGIKIKRKDGE
jgi:hypothetical protein